MRFVYSISFTMNSISFARKTPMYLFLTDKSTLDHFTSLLSIKRKLQGFFASLLHIRTQFYNIHGKKTFKNFDFNDLSDINYKKKNVFLQAAFPRLNRHIIFIINDYGILVVKCVVTEFNFNSLNSSRSEYLKK